MPRKMKDREDISSKLPSRMESVPGAIEAPKKRERRSRHPDIEQMMQDMQIEEQEEQLEKVESLRENIDASETDTLSKELRDFQHQARDIQASLESDGIGPDMYSLDDEMEFDRRLRSMSRKNATGFKKFWNGLGSMLTGGPADPEFFDEILDRYFKLQEVEHAIERRQARLDEISAPERNKKRGRVPRMPSGSKTYVSGIRGGTASIDGAGDLNLAKSFKESYQARGGAKKVRKALEEIKRETEHLEDTQAVIEQRESERVAGRVAAQDFEGTTADFEKSFGLDEEPKDESIDIDVSEFNEPAQAKEQLSRQETQAILRLDMMAKGLSDLRADISKVGNDESAALESQADFQDRMKEYEKSIESLIQANLDSTSDELYENVVAAQEELNRAKTAYDTVYTLIAEDARNAGKGKRVMGMVRGGGRSSGAKTYGSSAMDRAGYMRPAPAQAPEVAEEAWQKKTAADQAAFDAEAQKRDMQDEAIPLVTKKTRDRKREYAKQIKAAEAVEAERDGIKVEQVNEIKDPFAERQSYYASNAELMKWAIDSKNFNAAELWENVNSAIDSLDNYDRSELSTILKNAPDLAAAYVLEVAKVKRGDESARGHVIRANLVLNLPPEANIERSGSVVIDKAYQEDIKKAVKKSKKKAA
ncbi:hypothetical protein IT407_01675 [Candidatus Uhrbacteria bacterium]|nr:hypothetical protein [Candidatus Uhrbacteria bacterium]